MYRLTRTKEFDREYVLDQAMNVFWAQGYERTSINDLMKKMEISSQTLYNAFKDKHHLFLEAFDRYNMLGKITRKLLLFNIDSNLDDIQKFIEYLLELYTDTPGYGGCLLCNSIAEFGNSDLEIYNKILIEIKSLEDSFIPSIKNAIKIGQLKKETNPTNLSKFISTFISGISNMSKLGLGKKELQQQVDLFFDMIRSHLR